IAMVKVSRMPEVSIISTGDELVPVSGDPLPHEIRQSNGPALQALLGQYGLQSRLYHVRDEPGRIHSLLRQLRAGRAGCIITIGGVSAGKKDYVPAAVAGAGGGILFHKVAQRPGKPLLFAAWKDGPVLFGLPGNPVSCLASCCRYVIPWIRQGLQEASRPPLYAKLTEEVAFDPPLTCFLPVSLSYSPRGECMARPLRGKGSGDFVSMQEATAFLELPGAESRFEKGSAYRIWPIVPPG
ncbi:MAG TPA: molybdopterin-binding protein, partial [Anseongella sp.]|nr:molybdopterin-binding protein [Anseongella sp.]